MSDFEPLPAEKEAALRRVLQLEKQLSAVEWRGVQARVSARLHQHTTARLSGSDLAAVSSHALLLRRQADALEEAQRAAATARVLRFRLARLLNSWKP